MELELTKIVYEYTKNKKLADENFIKTCINICLDYKGLKYLVKDIIINENTGDSYYDCINQILLINSSQCIHHVTSINEYETVLHYNLEVLRIIIHECEHVMQCSICDNQNVSYKKRLLELCFGGSILIKKIKSADINYDESAILNIIKEVEYWKKVNKSYDKLYDYFPSERMADIKAYKHLINIFNKLDVGDFAIQRKYLNQRLAESQLLGYFKKDNIIIPPIFVFLYQLEYILNQKVDTDKIVADISKKSKYKRLGKRLMYGLNITTDEYEKIKNQIN